MGSASLGNFSALQYFSTGYQTGSLHQFVENESFKRFVGDMVYALTNQ